MTSVEGTVGSDAAGTDAAGRRTSSRPPLVLRVPVDPDQDRSPAELVAAHLAVTVGGVVRLEVAPADDSPLLPLALAERCQRLRDLGAPEVAWQRLTTGRVADAILRGGDDPGSLLCMGFGSRHAPTSMLFSSVTEEVLRRSSLPVLVIGPRIVVPSAPLAQVVVATEGSEVASRAVAVATDLSDRLGMPLRSLRVEPPGGDAPSPGPLPPRHGSGAAVEVVVGSDPASTILRAIGDAPTLLVIGAHKRGGRRRFALGSVALDLVRQATCPVLVVPAAGTRST